MNPHVNFIESKFIVSIFIHYEELEFQLSPTHISFKVAVSSKCLSSFFLIIYFLTTFHDFFVWSISSWIDYLNTIHLFANFLTKKFWFSLFFDLWLQYLKARDSWSVDRLAAIRTAFLFRNKKNTFGKTNGEYRNSLISTSQNSSFHQFLDLVWYCYQDFLKQVSSLLLQ